MKAAVRNWLRLVFGPSTYFVNVDGVTLDHGDAIIYEPGGRKVRNYQGILIWVVWP